VTSASKRLLTAVAPVIILIAGCRPSFVLVGDPFLQNSIPSEDELASRLKDAAGEVGFRARVLWPPVTEQEPLGAPVDLSRMSEDVVMLSPYQSLEMSDAAPDPVGPRVAVISSGATAPAWADTTIVFDSAPAYRRAGQLAAEWSASNPDRQTILFHSEPSGREDAAAFIAGFEAVSESEGPALITERFRTEPTRQTLSDVFSRYVQGADTLFVLLLGRADQTALELLRGADIRLGLRGVDPELDPARIVFSVRDDLVAAGRSLMEVVAMGEAHSTLFVESSLLTPAGRANGPTR
jgi:hypothetical protein